jgi:hypothetical protein
MSDLLIYAITALLMLVVILAVVDFVLTRSKRVLVVYTIAVVLAVTILYLTTGFPFPNQRQSFGGGASPFVSIGLMMAGIVCGMVCHYLYKRKRSFSWYEFVRPLVVSPIVLLPLMGSVGELSLEPIQVVSVALLGFQNGFFWQEVLKGVVPSKD